MNTSELAILMSQFMTDAFTRLRCSGFVSVCLINGSAVGGGAEIATVCDYRYKINFTENFFHPSEHYYIVLTKFVVEINNLFFDVRLMIDTPGKYICFIHAKIGASPGWGGASRLVSIVGEKITDVFSKTEKGVNYLFFFFPLIRMFTCSNN